ncbi:hypothetical protein AC1031_003285 [Aphanomyces cochlioides]|nr:hypothetical protein AC1031_003285 [Aphanomyces cochlioides]
MTEYTIAQVDKCRFTAWYECLRKVSIKSIAIPLPETFVETLLADKIQVNEQLYDQTFVNAVKQSIETLGGSVFAKLDWSSPKDAKWILGNSLRCRTFEDIVVLLKASDFVLHDLTQSYNGCTDALDKKRPDTFHLVLKKWCNFYDSMHFRCFVVHGMLTGISQRNCSEFYDFLQSEATQDTICDAITSMFEKHLKLCEVLSEPNYVFDVYVDKNNRVFLLDINVFGSVTDSLLFEWDELYELLDQPKENVDFRVVTQTQSAYTDPFSQYRVPIDLIDHLATPGGFDEFIRQVAQDNAAHGSRNDDDNVSTSSSDVE